VLLGRADTTLRGGRLFKSNDLKSILFPAGHGGVSQQDMAAFDAFVPARRCSSEGLR